LSDEALRAMSWSAEVDEPTDGKSFDLISSDDSGRYELRKFLFIQESRPWINLGFIDVRDACAVLP
jgi:hypothetical protein